MEFAVSCVRFCLSPCLPDCILDTVCADFDGNSPLCGDRCDIYWRDNIMIAGLILDIAALAYAFFTGATFFTFATATIAIILAFGMYYVSRFAEQRSMAEQLGTFRHTVGVLTHNTAAQLVITRAAQDQLDQSRAHNKELSATAALSAQTVERLGTELNTLRNADQLLVEANRQFQDVSTRVTAATAQLTDITTQLNLAQTRLVETQRQDAGLRAEILENTRALTDVRRQVSEEVTVLRSVSAQVQSNVARHTALLDATPHAPPTPSHAASDTPFAT